MAIRPENIKKECPECAWLMELDTDDFTFWCPNPNCEYTEFCEDGKPAGGKDSIFFGEGEEEEDEDKFRCPHCHMEIEEEELP